ncbi:ABC transporter permease [Candidatus Saccharibacteria bacterium]|nr:ABC transporter permease [Candidatus Saccharibacteria bacterium]
MKSKLFTVYVFTKISTKRFFRDKLAIFFTIAFPLIFLFVFGGIFGNNSDASFNVAIINQSKSEFAKNFVKDSDESKALKVDQDIDSVDGAKDAMNRGELDAAIILPEQFGVLDVKAGYPSGQAKVIYSQNNEQAGKTLEAILQGQFQAINAGLVEQKTPFSVTSEQTNDQGLSSFDYIFSGLLGFSIIGIGIFGPMNVFPELKKQGILRRFHTTTLRVWQYFLSNVISQAIIGLVAFAIQFAVAIAVFDLKVIGNPLELAVFLVFGTVTILGIGLALGGWAKNERQVAPLGNIIVFPMMFLSGTFFPRFLMPEWLQKISAFIPLTPIVDGIRLIATEGKHLWEIGPQLGLIGLWFIVIYAIAFKVFRWE